MNRRKFLGGLMALSAPAIIMTPGLLMPVKRVVLLPRIIREPWFVALNGNDSNDGTSDRPFLSIDRAIIAARNSDNKTICVRPGIHTVWKPMKADDVWHA